MVNSPGIWPALSTMALLTSRTGGRPRSCASRRSERIAKGRGTAWTVGSGSFTSASKVGAWDAAGRVVQTSGPGGLAAGRASSRAG
jgi:hypothetical protein